MEWFKEIKEVERGGSLDPGRLAEDYLLPGTPLLITGALRGTRLEAWSPEYLAERIGPLQVPVNVSANGRYDLDQEPSFRHPIETKEVRMSDFLTDILENPGDRGEEQAYLQQTSIPDIFPELVADVPVSKLVRPELVDTVNLWVGPPHTISPLHYDVSNNFLLQVFGRKRVVLFESDQTACLYPYEVGVGRHPHLSMANIDAPDFEAHPLLREATPTVAVLEPGDVLVVPSCCWHQVYGLAPSISVNVWWRVLDGQMNTPGYMRMIPASYNQAWSAGYRSGQNIFDTTIRHSYDSLVDFVSDLRSGCADDEVKFVCHLMLLQRRLEGLGQRYCIQRAPRMWGIDATLDLASRLTRAGVLSCEESDDIEAWCLKGREFIPFGPASFDDLDGTLDAMFEALNHLEVTTTPDGRPSLNG